MSAKLKKSCFAKFAVLMMASVVAFTAIMRGDSFCLCDDDPDGCGEPCHECDAPHRDADGGADAGDCAGAHDNEGGGAGDNAGDADADGDADEDGCVHLEISAADFIHSDASVQCVAIIFQFCALPASASLSLAATGAAKVPRSASPPSATNPYAALLPRLNPLS